MNIYELLESTRAQLLLALDLLIDPPDVSAPDKALQILQALTTKVNKTENLFSIESLVFGIFIMNVKHSYTKTHKDEHVSLRDELLGKSPHWHSYVIKNDLSRFMGHPTTLAYTNLQGALELYKEILVNKGDNINQLENLLEELHLLCYQQILVTSLSDLIVCNASHTLLSLPLPPRATFDIEDEDIGWGHFGHVSSMEKTESQIIYIESLLQKLLGLSPIYIDIHFQAEGFIINLR